ncbi:MAG: hypothetical protein HY942_04275 [Gammaproteobacteria bacterium]|nr:hypothetical protein [Gammaproteobacteria bacterium]
MSATLKTLLDICLLRGRPQDLPASKNLVAVTALLSIAGHFTLDQLHQDAFARLTFAAAQTALLGAVVWALLKLRGYPERWLQTVTALFFANIVADIVTWLAAAHALGPEASAPEPWVTGFVLATAIWFIAIMAQVLRHALAVSLGLAVLASLGCALASGLALMALFPEVIPR